MAFRVLTQNGFSASRPPHTFSLSLSSSFTIFVSSLLFVSVAPDVRVQNQQTERRQQQRTKNAKQIQSTQQNVMTHEVKYDANATLN